jgi:hypothetical protein
MHATHRAEVRTLAQWTVWISARFRAALIGQPSTGDDQARKTWQQPNNPGAFAGVNP